MASAPSRVRPRTRGSGIWYLMLLPAVLVLVGLLVIPFIASIGLSFQQIRFAQDAEWVGLANFTRAFADPQFGKALGITLLFTVVGVGIQLVLAWSIALLLWSTVKRASGFVRVLFAIPMLLSPVVVGVVWRVLLNPQYGWLAAVWPGEPLDLLGTPSLALPTMIAVDVWQWTPFLFIIIASALNSVPDEVLEAARLDGASGFRLFRSIIWPLCLPVTLVALLFRILDALKTFDLPFNLTQGGPGTATQTVAVYIYRTAFTRFDQGYGVAMALITTVIITVIALVLLRGIRQSTRSIS